MAVFSHCNNLEVLRFLTENPFCYTHCRNCFILLLFFRLQLIFKSIMLCFFLHKQKSVMLIVIVPRLLCVLIKLGLIELLMCVIKMCGIGF